VSCFLLTHDIIWISNCCLSSYLNVLLAYDRVLENLGIFCNQETGNPVSMSVLFLFPNQCLFLF